MKRKKGKYIIVIVRFIAINYSRVCYEIKFYWYTNKKKDASNTIFDGILLFCHIFFGMSLNRTILNHDAIAWYCLIIPGDEIDGNSRRKTIVHVCTNLRLCGCWRKCVKYECLIRFNIEFSNRNCLRLLSWLWCALFTHAPILTRPNGPKKLYFYRHFSNPIKTFSIFCSCWFSIRHLSFTYKSSIKISHIMELNINFWFTGNDTSYQCKYVRTHLSIASFSLSLSLFDSEMLRFG